MLCTDMNPTTSSWHLSMSHASLGSFSSREVMFLFPRAGFGNRGSTCQIPSHWLSLHQHWKQIIIHVWAQKIYIYQKPNHFFVSPFSDKPWRTLESQRANPGLRPTVWLANEPCSCVSLRATPTTPWTVSRNLEMGAWEWLSRYDCSCTERLFIKECMPQGILKQFYFSLINYQHDL